jgi:hypothetical protein
VTGDLRLVQIMALSAGAGLVCGWLARARAPIAVAWLLCLGLPAAFLWLVLPGRAASDWEGLARIATGLVLVAPAAVGVWAGTFLAWRRAARRRR